MIWAIAFIIIVLVLLFYLLAKKFKAVRKIYIITTLVVMVLYILWRLFFTLAFQNVASAIFSILFFAAELLGLFVAVFFILLFLQKKQERPDLPVWQPGYQPSIDVLICTYDEPIKLVIASALAAQNLPYPNKSVYICDDGHRPELKAAAQKYEIGYISRGDNKAAKAGNLNHALSLTKGELFVILDADFIVKPNFITEAVPYFQDKQVAMVQYPQAFYNNDAFQRVNPKLFNEQDFFMRYIEPQLAKQNAIVHIGTNAILRRSAVEEVGGIPTKSVTEDLATGVMLQNRGYKTLYINKAYALGLSPYKLKDLKNQRERWARGMIQVFKQYHPLRMKGLNYKQKLIYSELAAYWYTSFQKLIYLILPTLFIVFNIFIMYIGLPQILLITIPTLLMFALNFRLLIGKTRTFTQSHIYDALIAPYHAGALLKEMFGRKSEFLVTPKAAMSENSTNIGPLVTHIVLTVWLVFSLAVAVWRGVNGLAPVLALAVCAGWTLYNLYALVHAILVGTRKTSETAGEAFSTKISEDIRHNKDIFSATDLSFDGFKLAVPKGYSGFFTPGKSYEFTVVRTGLTASVEFIGRDKDRLEFQFYSLSKEAARRLSKYYTEKLHAAREMDFDREDILQNVIE